MNERINTSIIPEDDREAIYETVSRPAHDVAKEVFSIRAHDLIFKFQSMVDLVTSPEWKEASDDLMNMAGRDIHGEVMSDFFVRNANLLNRKRDKWTDLRKF